MKRSALKPGKPLERKTPMSRGTSTLQAKAPMNRGSSRLRAAKPKADKPKRAAREAEDRDPMDLCRGQPCYLLLPGIRCTPIETTAPCHSNQAIHGKGGGLKAHNRYTVPGCAACHRELDQGMRFTKEEKFAFWDRAYAAWLTVRTKMQVT
jgi:hypothetical protein